MTWTAHVAMQISDAREAHDTMREYLLSLGAEDRQIDAILAPWRKLIAELEGEGMATARRMDAEDGRG